MVRFHSPGNHVVVCGCSNVTESVIDELQRRNVPYVVVDPREELVLHLRNKGHDVLAGDPTRAAVLRQANLRRRGDLTLNSRRPYTGSPRSGGGT